MLLQQVLSKRMCVDLELICHIQGRPRSLRLDRCYARTQPSHASIAFQWSGRISFLYTIKQIKPEDYA